MVAIKLVEDLSDSDLTRTRLLREAQHASALNQVEALTAGSPWQQLSSDRRFADLLRRLGLGG